MVAPKRRRHSLQVVRANATGWWLLLTVFCCHCGGEVQESHADASTPDVALQDAIPDMTMVDVVVADTSPQCGVVGASCCGSTCSNGVCCQGACVDTSLDAKNCGSCGHDCLTSTCGSSACVATQLAHLPADTDPEALRVDAANVYWANVNGGGGNLPGVLYSCPKQGCGSSPSKLYGSINYARSLILDTSAKMTYVADSGAKTLLRCSSAGCGGTPLSVSKALSSGLDLRNGWLYGVVSAQPHQFRPDGTSDIDLGNGAEDAYDIAAPPSSGYVYWTEVAEDRIRVGVSGSPNSATDFVITLAPARIIATSTHLIWHSGAPGGSTISSCAIGSVCLSSTELAEKQILDWVFGGIASDGTNAYWTAYDYGLKAVVLRSCAVTGCNKNPVTITSVPAASPLNGLQMGGVAFDNDYFYFAFSEQGTYIYRVAR